MTGLRDLLQSKSAEEEVCSTREAAEILGVSLRTIQVWVDNGILDAWKTAGGHRRVSLRSVRRVKEGQYPEAGPGSDADPDVLLAYQPILDKEQKTYGYELLYRSGTAKRARFQDPVAATAKVIRVAFGELGVLSAMGDAVCFINVDAEMLASDVLLTLPADRIVLEVPAETEPTDEVLDHCRRLHGAGYRLLLDNFVPGVSPQRLLPVMTFVKVDWRSAAALPPVSGWLPPGTKLVAGRLETKEAYALAQHAGASYFQGHYFAKPDLVRGTTVAPYRMTILEVLAMTIADADLADIERRIKVDPAICFSLLRLTNSAAFRSARQIDNIREMILLLGRKNLQRWLQVLLFAHESDPGRFPSPLLLAAAFRGRLLEYLAVLTQEGGNFPEKAFMVGMLSFLEALLHVPLSEVLRGLHLSDDVVAALLRREGPLGDLLSLAEALDRADFDEVQARARSIGIGSEPLRSGFLDSMHFRSTLAHA